MLMKNLCQPKSQVKLPLNIPNDPRRKHQSCGQSNVYNEKNSSQERARKIVINSLKDANRKIPMNQKVLRKKGERQKISESESSMGFLQASNNDDMTNRPIGYQDQGGTSFGAHLLRKSKPLLSEALDQKLKFKRDSAAGEIIFQKQRKLTQPFFINEVDSDELFQYRKTELNVDEESTTCPPPRLAKRNFYNNQFLTTYNRAKEGLKFVVANNYPHLPPDSPTGSLPVRKEILDECGRKTHHPKLKARDLGKRLCEAPSMTQELEKLYKEYMERCPDGNEQSEACRFLRHAPSPHHREVRRSILKDQHAFGLDVRQSQHQQRRSSGKGHMVRFDKDVDLMGTAITKINGMNASLQDTDGRHKLLRQQGGWISTTNTNHLQKEEQPERYPLHVRNLVKVAPTTESNPHLDWLRRNEIEELEEKNAKQDLARIYFATEATRIVACSTLPSLNRKMNVFTKMESARRPPFPHFFMDRLENDMEMENKRKKENRLASINNEMDAFDESLKVQSVSSSSNFDPLIPPSEKSLNDLKLKMEIMRQQRERDVKAAATRHRTRKSYFHKMLPCFADMIADNLMEYSIKRACKLSGEEMILARDLLMVANQREILHAHRRGYDDTEYLAEGEGRELPREGEKIVKDILDICLDVVVKISNFTQATGKEPPKSLQREWRDAGFSLLNQHDISDGRSEQDAEMKCSEEGTSEEDTGSTSQYRRSSDFSKVSTDEGDTSLSGKGDDDNHMRCLIALKTVRESKIATPSTMEGKPVTKVNVQVTDCLHEDIESALTYDGVYLPLTESKLSQSSSLTKTESSATPSGTPTDSPAESFTNCLTGKPPANLKHHLEGYHYEEYEGENGEYFDENGEMVIPIGNTGGFVSKNYGHGEVELTEETLETTAEGEAIRMGEVDVQAIDYSEGDSPDGIKQTNVRHLQFNEELDTHSANDGEARRSRHQGGSTVSLTGSIKFHLPRNFESKRNPIRRKKTAFVPSDALDDFDSIDDDVDRDDESGERLTLDGDNDDFLREHERLAGEHSIVETEEEYETNETGDGKLDARLGNISYGMNNTLHEKRFLEHRVQQLKQFSETWRKGLFKPPGVFTRREKNSVSCSTALAAKRIPPCNILDTHIPRPTFNLRVKKLIGMVEKAKLEENKCTERAVVEQVGKSTGCGQSEATKSVERIIFEKCKGKSNKKVPSWHKEIAEYECRRKERQTLMEETQVDDDYAKRLGFDALYKDSSIRQTFMRGDRNSTHVRISDTESLHNEEEQDNQYKQSSLRSNNPHLWIPHPDETILDNCAFGEYDDLDNLDVEEGDYPKYCPNQDIPLQETKYWEIPGEGHYEMLEFPIENVQHDETERDNFSVQEMSNE